MNNLENKKWIRQVDTVVPKAGGAEGKEAAFDPRRNIETVRNLLLAMGIITYDNHVQTTRVGKEKHYNLILPKRPISEIAENFILIYAYGDGPLMYFLKDNEGGFYKAIEPGDDLEKVEAVLQSHAFGNDDKFVTSTESGRWLRVGLPLEFHDNLKQTLSVSGQEHAVVGMEFRPNLQSGLNSGTVALLAKPQADSSTSGALS